MDQQKIGEFKERLENEKKKLVTQLEAMTDEKSFDKDKIQVKWKDIGDKEEDNAVEVANYQDSISLERDLEANLDSIVSALTKIENGSYGICEKCGKPIGEDRLAALPQAAKCRTCAVEK